MKKDTICLGDSVAIKFLKNGNILLFSVSPLLPYNGVTLEPDVQERLVDVILTNLFKKNREGK